MSAVALFGALETGLIYGLVALGVFLTFRVLQFPISPSRAVFRSAARLRRLGLSAAAMRGSDCAVRFFGRPAAAGWVTAFLSVRAKILHLVASILTMIALFSINIRIMGRPNISLLGETSIFSAPEAAFDFDSVYFRPLLLALLTLAICALAVRFLHSEFGLACARRAQIRECCARKAAIRAISSFAGWRCRTAWSPSPAPCLRKRTASPM